jgi:sec-independent protein translocase protein TatA
VDQDIRPPPKPASQGDFTGVQRRFGTLVSGVLMPFQLGLPEIILVLVIALVFLGPKRLPEAGQALGKGMREFRQGMSGFDHQPESVTELPPALPVYTPPPAYIPPPDAQPVVYTPPSEDQALRQSDSE